MDIEAFREYCLAKKGVEEGFPFGEDTLVFKVMGKMFALTSLSSTPWTVNLKMDAGKVPEYRERYADVQPGWHMNKKMWNTVTFDSGSIPRRELLWMVDHSYEEVVRGLTKKLRNELELL
ncbi:MAG: MmcQ/YjbR family DNA-binding protein [Bacteroidetes bacterium]|nr:MmcQ/YjbR family DNA-binding protein [Bacteroidota bacterium]